VTKVFIVITDLASGTVNVMGQRKIRWLSILPTGLLQFIISTLLCHRSVILFSNVFPN